MRQNLMEIARLTAMLLGLVGFSQTASAVTIVPQTPNLSINGTAIQLGVAERNINGSYLLSGTSENGDYGVSWNVEYRTNPYLFSDLTVTNFTGSSSNYNVILNSPAASSTVTKGGSVGYLLTDANNNGTATLASLGGGPLYKAFVDGAQELQLMGVSDTCNSVGCTSNNSAIDGVASLVTSATPKPVATSLLFTDGVTNDLGITLDFSLSAGDKVNFQSYFQVTPVPVPAAVWLFGSALLGLFGMKRSQLVHRPA